MLAILTALRIDGTIQSSWWVVFSPIWCSIAFRMAQVVHAWIRRRALPKHDETDGPPTSPPPTASLFENNEDQEKQRTRMSGLELGCTILCINVLTSPFYILALRLQSDDFSSFFVLLPWLCIVSGYIHSYYY